MHVRIITSVKQEVVSLGRKVHCHMHNYYYKHGSACTVVLNESPRALYYYAAFSKVWFSPSLPPSHARAG